MCRDLDLELAIKIITDAEAAQRISLRKGIGGVRHLEVHQLWIQEKVRGGDIAIEKVWGGGEFNIADACAKPMWGDSQMHVQGSSSMPKDGQRELSPQVAEEDGISGCKGV